MKDFNLDVLLLIPDVVKAEHKDVTIYKLIREGQINKVYLFESGNVSVSTFNVNTNHKTWFRANEIEKITKVFLS